MLTFIISMAIAHTHSISHCMASKCQSKMLAKYRTLHLGKGILCFALVGDSWMFHKNIMFKQVICTPSKYSRNGLTQKKILQKYSLVFYFFLQRNIKECRYEPYFKSPRTIGQIPSDMEIFQCWLLPLD